MIHALFQKLEQPLLGKRNQSVCKTELVRQIY